MRDSRYKIRRRELIAGGMALGLFTAARRGVSQALTLTDGNWSETTFAQVRKFVEMFRLLGQPLPPDEAARVLSLSVQRSDQDTEQLATILDRYTLMRVRLDAHGVGKCVPGGADRRLVELGWRTFLVRVENPAKLTGAMSLVSRSAIPEGDLQPGLHDSHILGNDIAETIKSSPDVNFDYDRDSTQWLGFRFGTRAGLDGLEGAAVEYQILQIYSEVRGPSSASIAACLAAVSPARRVACEGFGATFTCSPASTVTLNIRDWDRRGATASLLICDEAGRVYPAPGHRLEPDLGYQWQIYRSDAETVRLPAGRYRLVVSRGPEYRKSEHDLAVPPGGAPASLIIELERWINPPRFGWYPGEPHIHPEGQVFGIVSKLGLVPETLLRQVRGEALSVASILIWTAGYYYEKAFLTGHVYEPTYALPFPEVQRANNVSLVPMQTPHDEESVMRYDVEQAAFPSNRFGHPILLRVRNHDYPEGRSVYDWPSWNLPVLQWARAQGAIAGYAHSGNSMTVDASGLPNYEIPTMDGLGANECLVDVTHGFVDFIAGGESPPVADLNVWYHLLNCGFNIPMIGETDFPVGAGTRIMGTVRTYVGLDRPPRGDAGYYAWVEGIKAGRVYFGDGRSHLIDFRADNNAVGEGPVTLSRPGRVTLSVRVAAWLDETPGDPESAPGAQGYAHWHLERARIGSSRKVPLEVVVNGRTVERREVLADGQLRTMSVATNLSRSSWIALRIIPSVHTAPIIVSVHGMPVRASRRSARWCLECIEVLWRKHARRIRESERAAAEAAWDHARNTYRTIESECAAD